MFEFIKKRPKKNKVKPLSMGVFYGSAIDPAIRAHPRCRGARVTSVQLKKGESFIGFDKNPMVSGHIFVYSFGEKRFAALDEMRITSDKKIGRMTLSESTRGFRVDDGKSVCFLINPRLLKLNNWINLDDLISCKSTGNTVGK